MRALLPVLTTRRTDHRDRGYLAWVAVANEVAHLALESAPIDASPHLLEIHIDGFDEPLVLLAEPVGPPDEQGFPLKLKPLDDAHEDALRAQLFGAPPAEPRPPARAPASEEPSMSRILTQEHAASLSSAPPAPQSRRSPGILSGRSLGGGRFEMGQLLGSGSAGDVYRATHNALRRAVAVKVLHPSLEASKDFGARFHAEALAVSRLDHPNVLRVLDYGQEPEGMLYIVMELLEGRDLDSVLRDDGPLELTRLVDLVSQACAGIAHAHDAGVIHRDVKPENIVLVSRTDDDGVAHEHVKVCDFGIASQGSVSAQTPGALVGTPAFMAPEQIRGEAVDARTDVYAIGCVLYELATGKVPFDGDDPVKVLERHLTEAPKAPSVHRPELGELFDHLVLGCLAKDPRERPATARVLRGDLRRLVDKPRPSGLLATEHLKPSTSPSPGPTTADFVARPAETLAALEKLEGELAATAAFMALEDALRQTIASRSLGVAKEIFGWLTAHAADASFASRDRADRALLAMREPAVGEALAAFVFDAPGRPDDVFPLLESSGACAARALVEARKNMAASLDARARFTSALRASGAAGLPSLLEGLEPLVGLAAKADEAFAEDLLRAIPETRADAAGELVVRFVRVDKPQVAAVALRALTSLWSDRAHSMLIGAIDASDVAIRVAAVESLGRLTTIDAWTVDRLVKIVAAQGQTPDEMRAPAARALGLASDDAKEKAITFCRERLASQPRIVTSILSAFGGTREVPTVMLELARALLALEGANARAVVEKVAQARPELRAELDGLLAKT